MCLTKHELEETCVSVLVHGPDVSTHPPVVAPLNSGAVEAVAAEEVDEEDEPEEFASSPPDVFSLDLDFDLRGEDSFLATWMEYFIVLFQLYTSKMLEEVQRWDPKTPALSPVLA